jgi:hypothetical protein
MEKKRAGAGGGYLCVGGCQGARWELGYVGRAAGKGRALAVRVSGERR